MLRAALAKIEPLRVVASLFVGSLLASCAAAPPASPPPAGEAAVIEANRRADAYVRTGNLDSAVRYYREAIRVAQSVEDAEGIAANAINLSIVYQRLGKHAEARASLAPVLDRTHLSFPPERLAQAALRRSVLDMDERHFASAMEWIERAAAHCNQRSCALSGAIHNVKGQLALEAGQLDVAAASARAALGASRSSGDLSEVANALRLLGITAIRSDETSAAPGFLREALAIDRELGAPRKIYLDLVSLGRLSALRGERDAARSFYERALAVSEADRDLKGAAEARTLINALSDKPGSRQDPAAPTPPDSHAGQ